MLLFMTFLAPFFGIMCSLKFRVLKKTFSCVYLKQCYCTFINNINIKRSCKHFCKVAHNMIYFLGAVDTMLLHVYQQLSHQRIWKHLYVCKSLHRQKGFRRVDICYYMFINNINLKWFVNISTQKSLRIRCCQYDAVVPLSTTSTLKNL